MSRPRIGNLVAGALVFLLWLWLVNALVVGCMDAGLTALGF